MNSNELQDKIIATDFSVGGSTTRVRFIDRTLFLKSDSGKWHPQMTFYPDLIIDYSNRMQHGDLSSLTCNNLSRMKTALYEAAHKRWPDIGTFRVFPSGDEAPMSQYVDGLERVEKGTAFMLAHGIWPADGVVGTGFRAWHKPDLHSIDQIKDIDSEHIREVFEKFVARLAYQTVYRENLLRDTSKEIIQHLQKCKDLSDEYTALIQGLVNVNFVPPKEEDCANRQRFIDPFKAGLKIVEQSNKIREATRAMSTLSFGMYDAGYYRRGSRLTKNNLYSSKLSDDSILRIHVDSGLTAWGNTPEDLEDAENLMKVLEGGANVLCQTGIYSPRFGGKLVFRNPSVYASYYGFRNKFAEIKNTLGTRMGYVIPELFGAPSEEWDILEIAAPEFLAERS